MTRTRKLAGTAPSTFAHSRMLGLLTLCALVAVGGVCRSTRADEPQAEPKPVVLAGEVLVLLASEKEGPIDPSLSHVRALKHPPFNSFKSMRLLSRSAVKLVSEQAVDLYLPNGRIVQLTLVARLPDGRAKVEVSINRSYEHDYLPLMHVIASPGEPFFVAGQKFEGGTLVIGVRVGERPKR
jgi:hypothetical protein